MKGTVGEQRWYSGAACAVVVLGALLRLWGLDGGLPHLMTRPDEEIIVLQTRLPAEGQFDLEWPGAHPGIPSAYIFLLWAFGEVGLRVLQLAGSAPPGDYLAAVQFFPDRLLLTERFLSAMFGIGTIVALLWAARREVGERTALLAALLLAVATFHVRDSHSAKPDIALGFFVMLSLGLLAPLTRAVTKRGAVFAGLAIGLAMAMKPPGVLLMLPAWVAVIAGSDKESWRRVFPSEIFLLGTVATLVFVLTSPDFVFNTETAERIFSIVGLVFPQLVPGAEVPTGGADVGSFPGREASGGFVYHYLFSIRYGLGPVAMVVLPLALVWAAFSRNALLALAALFSVVSFFVFGSSPALLSRYMAPVFAPLALLVGAFVVAVVQRLPRGAHMPGLALAAVVLVVEPLHASIAFDRLMAGRDTRNQATEWLAAHSVPGDRVALTGSVFWTWGDPQVPRGRKAVRPTPDRHALAEAQADFLVTHDHPLFSSTTDPAAIAALGDGWRLVAEFDPFPSGTEGVVFEGQDAFYVPTRGAERVTATGPIIRIYATR